MNSSLVVSLFLWRERQCRTEVRTDTKKHLFTHHVVEWRHSPPEKVVMVAH